MWKVSFGTTPKQHHRWLQGWGSVAKDNNLKPGEVIVCVLVRKSRFHFKVFGKDGNMSTERSTSTTNDNKVKKEPNVTSQSHQEPSISTPDLKHPMTRKRLFELQKEAQVAEPSYQKKKLQNCGENFEAAVCRSLATENEGSKSRSEIPSTKTVQTTSKKAEKSYGANSGNPHQCSSVPAVLHLTNPVDPFAYSIKSRRRVTTALERQKAWDAAMAHANTLDGVHFISVMSETQVYRDFHLVSIPKPSTPKPISLKNRVLSRRLLFVDLSLKDLLGERVYVGAARLLFSGIQLSNRSSAMETSRLQWEFMGHVQYEEQAQQGDLASQTLGPVFTSPFSRGRGCVYI